MIHFRGVQTRVVLVGLVSLSAIGLVGEGRAARVEGIYSASAPLSDASAEAMNAAFAEALGRVLVKVSGRATAREPSVLSHFAEPAAMVQQFRRDNVGTLWAQFDPEAVRRGLAAAGVPTWGEDRPTTVIWLAFDTGGGERDVLSGAAEDSLTGALRRDLLTTAEARAIPVVLPLRDSQELSVVTYADVWGDFSEPLIKASQRYQADAVLVGRARLFPAGMTDVRWTLLLGDERLEWRGGIADGPAGLADRLAQRLTSTAAGAERLRLSVSGIRTLDQYGQLLGYLQGLDVIENVGVSHVTADWMVFDLVLRGDRDRLTRALAVRRLVEPESIPPEDAMPTALAASDLTYRLVGGL